MTVYEGRAITKKEGLSTGGIITSARVCGKQRTRISPEAQGLRWLGTADGAKVQ